MRLDHVTRDRTAVATISRALPDAIAIYVFGSAAAGVDGPESDLDLAVLPAHPLDPVARFDLQEDLASALHTPVDLVDLRAASPVMAMQVLSTGRVLHDREPASRGRFEDLIFGAYARLNEERRAILQRVASEGTVYGR